MNFERTFIGFVKYAFRRVGLGITSYSTLSNLRRHALNRTSQDLELIRAINPANYELMINLLLFSKSQLRQDLFVLSEMNNKKQGFFVEFGAANGIDFSNTYLLETEFFWKGILVEPSRFWKESLQVNRPLAIKETLAIWSESNLILKFNEVDVPELSTLDLYSNKDNHKNTRRSGNKYNVNTISLRDLLRKYEAPVDIDYLSIDTEGSEFEILNAFNFDEYNIKVITVEHNHTPQRELIYNLLTKYGYKRKYEKFSNFDDWYVRI